MAARVLDSCALLACYEGEAPAIAALPIDVVGVGGCATESQPQTQPGRRLRRRAGEGEESRTRHRRPGVQTAGKGGQSPLAERLDDAGLAQRLDARGEDRNSVAADVSPLKLPARGKVRADSRRLPHAKRTPPYRVAADGRPPEISSTPADNTTVCQWRASRPGGPAAQPRAELAHPRPASSCPWPQNRPSSVAFHPAPHSPGRLPRMCCFSTL